MATFFATHAEADMAPMGHDSAGMGHLFPSNSCQSPPGVLYSAPWHLMAHRGPPTPCQTPPTHHDELVVNPSYPPHPSWTSQPPLMQPTHVAYSPYQQRPLPTSTHALLPDMVLLPQPLGAPLQARSHSVSSSLGMASTSPGNRSLAPLSRSLSPGLPDLRAHGRPNKNGTWSCSYPGCTSRAVFARGCDLRKHHKRHTKSFFCRHEKCPQATGGGFSSKKDLARHEAKHNPGVQCDWDNCNRVFSRVDNMRDHVKRIHLKAARSKIAAGSKRDTL